MVHMFFGFTSLKNPDRNRFHPGSCFRACLVFGATGRAGGRSMSFEVSGMALNPKP